MRAGLDLAGLVSDVPARAILDEVQRMPALFAALKLDADRRRLPGRLTFLVTSPCFPHQFVKSRLYTGAIELPHDQVFDLLCRRPPVARGRTQQAAVYIVRQFDWHSVFHAHVSRFQIRPRFALGVRAAPRMISRLSPIHTARFVPLGVVRERRRE